MLLARTPKHEEGSRFVCDTHTTLQTHSFSTLHVPFHQLKASGTQLRSSPPFSPFCLSNLITALVAATAEELEWKERELERA